MIQIPPKTKRPTFVFTDIVDSSKMATALGPARYVQDLQRPHDEIVRNAIAQYNGYEDNTIGDSFFLAFETPQDALACVCSIEERLHANQISAVDQQQHTWTLTLKIGIHTAESDVEFHPTEHYRSHPDVNFASRVQSLASPEQILVSAETWRALQSTSLYDGKWQPWPDRWIKSFEHAPQTLYEFLWDGKKRSAPVARWMPRFLLRETSAFVGREAYLKQTIQWLKGDRPLLLLHGAGGIGKTRLAAQASLAVVSHFQGRIYGVALDAEFPMQTASAASVSAGDLAERIATSTTPGESDSSSAPPASAQPTSATEVTPAQLALRIALATEAHKDLLNDATAERVLADLERRFADKPFLLVLDNFESVNNPETRSFLAELAMRVPNSRCLVTCRTNFDISPFLDSHEVTGLDIPTSASDNLEQYEAYQLFRERVGQSIPPRDLSDTESLFRILQATEGSALGIELVAARYRLDTTLSLKVISDGLQESLLEWQRMAKELGATRYGPGRHENIGASIMWSISLLPKQEQPLFPRLGVFPVDFDAKAGLTIADISQATLTRWVLAHLVQPDASRGRYTLQPVVREFAAGHISHDETPGLRDKFTAHYTLLAEHNDNINDATKLTVLRPELRNLYMSAEYLIRPTLVTEDARRLVTIGRALWGLPTRERAESIKRAITCYEAALNVYTETGFPSDWARTQNNLGSAYQILPTGNKAENLQRAITYHMAALRVFTETGFPSDWAMTQNNLGSAYEFLPNGNRAENLNNAIAYYNAALKVHTEIDFPVKWARTQNNLGNAYSDLPSGNRAENVQRAISYYEAALRVRNETDFPFDWATTQNSLGNALGSLPIGNKVENLTRAIGCFEAALRIFTETEFPSDWATAQTNLGASYNELPDAKRVENLQLTITCYEAALRVHTETEYPSAWAGIQNNLGNAYVDLPDDDRAKKLKHVMTFYQAALRVYTEADFPIEWAMTQNNSGEAYYNLGTDDRAENLNRAIRCFEAALRVFTEANFPAIWARLQTNLGDTYRSLPTGDQAENFQRAITYYEAAYRVRTEANFPSDWATTQNSFGEAYYALVTGNKLENLTRAIRCFEAALRVFTETDFPTEWAKTQNNLALARRQQSQLLATTGGLFARLRAWLRSFGRHR